MGHVRIIPGYGPIFDSAAGITRVIPGYGPFVEQNAGSGMPVSDFKADRFTTTVGSPIRFYDTSTGDPSSWAWDFGDGTTSTQQNPIKYYSTNGTFTVAMTATNSIGADAETKIAYVIVLEISGAGVVATTPGKSFDEALSLLIKEEQRPPPTPEQVRGVFDDV